MKQNNPTEVLAFPTINIWCNNEDLQTPIVFAIFSKIPYRAHKRTMAHKKQKTSDTYCTRVPRIWNAHWNFISFLDAWATKLIALDKTFTLRIFPLKNSPDQDFPTQKELLLTTSGLALEKSFDLTSCLSTQIFLTAPSHVVATWCQLPLKSVWRTSVLKSFNHQ